MKTSSNSGPWRQIRYVVLGAGLILLVPLLAMQLTDQVAWNWFDCTLMGALLICTGLTYVLAAQVVGTRQYQIILGCVLAGVLLLVWAELAVGVFGSLFAGS